MTVESCVSFCASKNSASSQAGYFAGVEYAQECYCASTLAATATQLPQAQCSMLCKGNDKEFCGAGSRLNVYSYNPSAAATMTGQPGVTPRGLDLDGPVETAAARRLRIRGGSRP
jgi:hypothetical protein